MMCHLMHISCRFSARVGRLEIRCARREVRANVRIDVRFARGYNAPSASRLRRTVGSAAMRALVRGASFDRVDRATGPSEEETNGSSKDRRGVRRGGHPCRERLQQRRDDGSGRQCGGFGWRLGSGLDGPVGGGRLAIDGGARHAHALAQLRHRGKRRRDQRARQGLHGREPERDDQRRQPAGRQLLRPAQDRGHRRVRAGHHDHVDGPLRPPEPVLPRTAQRVHPDGHAQAVHRHRLVLQGPLAGPGRDLRDARHAALQRVLQQGPVRQGRDHHVPDQLDRVPRRVREAEGGGHPAAGLRHRRPGAQRRLLPVLRPQLHDDVPAGERLAEALQRRDPLDRPGDRRPAHQVGLAQDPGLHEPRRPDEHRLGRPVRGRQGRDDARGLVGLPGVQRQDGLQRRRVRPAVHRHAGQGRGRVPG